MRCEFLGIVASSASGPDHHGAAILRGTGFGDHGANLPCLLPSVVSPEREDNLAGVVLREQLLDDVFALADSFQRRDTVEVCLRQQTLVDVRHRN